MANAVVRVFSIVLASPTQSLEPIVAQGQCNRHRPAVAAREETGEQLGGTGQGPTGGFRGRSAAELLSRVLC